MNKVFIEGNLIKDPSTQDCEFIDNSTGEVTKVKVCNFTMAVNDGFGENKTTTLFNVHAWRWLADKCSKFLTKGRGVIVLGTIHAGKPYKTPDGTMTSVLDVRAEEVKFLGAVKKDEPEDDFPC